MTHPLWEGVDKLRQANKEYAMTIELMRQTANEWLECKGMPAEMHDYARYRLMLASMYEEQIAHDERYLNEVFAEDGWYQGSKNFGQPLPDDGWKEFQAEVHRMEVRDKEMWEDLKAKGYVTDELD